MAKKLYINTAAADPASAFVQSATNPTSTTLPQFRLGDLEKLSLYLVDGLGGYDSESGSGALTVKFGMGNKASGPTGGTYTLTDGSVTTSAIAYNAIASVVQTALNALNSGAGPFSDTVTVTGTFPAFKLTFDTVGVQSLLAVGAGGNLLTPASGITLAEITAGTVSVAEVQSLYLAQSPVVFQETWTTITNGWEAQVSFATFELRDFITGESSDIWMEVEITDGSGNRVTRAQAKTAAHGEVIAEDALAPVGLPTYNTTTESNAAYVQNRSAVTGLAGVGSTKLAGIATAAGAAVSGWLVAVEITNTVSFYQLQAGTTPESLPDIVWPNDHATTTNEYIWVLMGITTTTNSDDLATLTTITAAGNSNVDVGAFSQYTVLGTCTDTYDATAFTHTIALQVTNAEQGDRIDLRLSMPASVDPTIEIRNATAGGTLLTTINPENSTDALPFAGSYAYDGTAWNEISATWID
jgi:hypothetical protein